MDLDIKYIKICIFLLKKIIGTSFPNPPVVSLVVESNRNKRDSKIVNFGFTNIGGRPHAEALALEGIKFRDNFNYTLYSTLEPCCHTGRGESCVAKILKSKINRVVYSLKDPDSRVNGYGDKNLRSSGMEVLGGVMLEKTKEIYDGYICNRRFNRPKVILKIGCSLDSKITKRPKKGDKITNEIVKKIVHIYRSEVDAILVGKNTINIDNPRLDCRINGLKEFSPMRVILSKKINFNLDSKIFKNCINNKTIIFTLKDNGKNTNEIKKKYVKIFMLEKKNFNITYIIKELAKLGVCNLLVEGGREIFTSFINEDLVDKIIIFRSNYFIGSHGLNLVDYLSEIKRKKYTLKHQSNLENNSMEVFEKEI